MWRERDPGATDLVALPDLGILGLLTTGDILHVIEAAEKLLLLLLADSRVVDTASFVLMPRATYGSTRTIL